MTQRSIELVIGRLVTDEEFRETFLDDPHQALGDLLAAGMHLTGTEVEALVSMDSELWTRVSSQVDPRLQKCCLGKVVTR